MGNTVAKSKILKIIREARNPITYPDIKRKMKGSCSRVTIYRVLNRLEKENLVHRFVSTDGNFRYSVCHLEVDLPSGHAHFCCIKCETVTCLKTKPSVSPIPEEYDVEEINFTVSGICPQCRTKAQNEAEASFHRDSLVSA